MDLKAYVDEETFEILGELVDQCHEDREVPSVLYRILHDLGPEVTKLVEEQIGNLT